MYPYCIGIAYIINNYLGLRQLYQTPLRLLLVVLIRYALHAKPVWFVNVLIMIHIAIRTLETNINPKFISPK